MTYVPRENSEGVPWGELAEALKLKFLQLIQDKNQVGHRTLSDDNLNHMARKLFSREPKPENEDYSQYRVTWEQFFQEGVL